MPSRIYPAWFHRVRSLVKDRQARGQHFRYRDHRLPTRPQDYDEDVSECSNDSEESDQSSMMSDISENYSSKEFQYYTMKEERNERKKELRRRKTGQGSNQDYEGWSEEAEIQKELKWEEELIEPIKEALAKAQQSSQTNSAPLSLGGRHFQLCSTDHVKYCTAETAPTRYIEFYDPEVYPTRRGKINGHIYMVEQRICDIDPFTPPKSPSLEFVRLNGNRGRHSFDIQFFDDHHLILKIPKDLVVYRQGISLPPQAPDVFTYYAECEAHQGRRFLAEERREAREKRRRSASPA